VKTMRFWKMTKTLCRGIAAMFLLSLSISSGLYAQAGKYVRKSISYPDILVEMDKKINLSESNRQYCLSTLHDGIRIAGFVRVLTVSDKREAAGQLSSDRAIKKSVFTSEDFLVYFDVYQGTSSIVEVNESAKEHRRRAGEAAGFLGVRSLRWDRSGDDLG